MEIYEYILRMAKSWVQQKYSAREPVSKHLERYFDLYIRPLCDVSNLVLHRDQIRKSEKLNELLFDNQKCLEILYNEIKPSKGGLSMEGASKFFNSIKHIQ